MNPQRATDRPNRPRMARCKRVFLQTKPGERTMGTDQMQLNKVCLFALSAFVACPLVAFAGPPGSPGDIYVSNGQNNLVVQPDGATGTNAGNFVAAGSGGLSIPVGVAWGPNGNLFVASYNNDSVRQYDGATGAFINVFAS